MSAANESRRRCPHCGEKVGKLPSHMRNKCPERPRPKDDRDPQKPPSDETNVEKSECARMRQAARNGMVATEISSEVDRTPSTVSAHLRGQCHCDTDEPELVWSQSEWGWVPK